MNFVKKILTVALISAITIQSLGLTNFSSVKPVYAKDENTIVQSQDSNNSTSTIQADVTKQEYGIIGDVNGDGNIDSTDFALMKRYVLQVRSTLPVENYMWVGDVNGDGEINSTDCALMKRFLLSIITKFPKQSTISTPTPNITPTPESTSVIEDPVLAPTNLKITSNTATSVSLSWEPSKSIIDGKMEYGIFANDMFIESTFDTQYTLTNLLPNETYEITVKSSDTKAISEPSNVCTIKLPVSNMEQLKNALIRNFEAKGTKYTVTYNGDVTDLNNKIKAAYIDAIKENTEPVIVTNVSISCEGTVGNVQITFEINYDDKNKYSDVLNSMEEFKTFAHKYMKERNTNINLIIKEKTTAAQIEAAITSILESDTYLECSIIESSYQWSSYSTGITGIRVALKYITTKEQEDYVDKTVQFLVSKMTDSTMNDHEKEKLIHDYILANLEYSDEEEYNNAYSALYYGKAKCNGYAMLTNKMLEAAGIENVIATNEDHGWNIVKIDNKWYHVDTTWDDNTEKRGYGFYRFYNVTDDEIIKSRAYAPKSGISCTTDYIEFLSAVNAANDGKYENILKDIQQKEEYVYINKFKENASMNLLYNEVVLKEGEFIALADQNIPLEIYKDSYCWESSDPEIADVTDGVITAKKAGVIKISAKPMYDMFFRSSLFCTVRVVALDSGDGKTLQNVSEQNFTGITNGDVKPQIIIHSKDNVNTSTKIKGVSEKYEGKINFTGDPINIESTSDFDWAEISFKYSEEQLENIDLDDMVIYWYDEKTDTLVPQATRVDKENGTISATVTHFSDYLPASKSAQDKTIDIAILIDTMFSDRATLDTFKLSIINTMVEVRKNSNILLTLIDNKTNKSFHSVSVSKIKTKDGNASQDTNLASLETVFKSLTPGGRTPSNNELLGSIQNGLNSGKELLNTKSISDVTYEKYVLAYTKWNGKFADNNSTHIVLGDTVGLIVGGTIVYYDGGQISYNQSNILPLAKFLIEGSYTQIQKTDTGKKSWVLKENGDNNKNDVIVLQKLLVALWHLKMPTDANGNPVSFGSYADLTKAAVEGFQKAKGIKEDGIVGKETWIELGLPWDYKNAEPDRMSYTYRYLFNNNNFYKSNPKVTLTLPAKGTKLEVGKKLKISATGTNCHHLAVFVNGKWVDTQHGSGDGYSFSLNYDYTIPSAGKYTIQVKGRNVPGSSGGTLVGSEIVTVDGYDNVKQQSLDGITFLFGDPEVWLTNKPLILDLYKLEEQLKLSGGTSFWELDSVQKDTIYRGLRIPNSVSAIDVINRIESLRSIYNIPVNKTVSIIDEVDIKCITQEELIKQAAETWKLRIPLYLETIKDKINKSGKSYVEFIDLSKQEIKAIQYSLKVHQSGHLDGELTNLLVGLCSKKGINLDVINKRWYVDIVIVNALIEKCQERLTWDKENKTLSEIRDFAEEYRLGELFYGLVVGWAYTVIINNSAADDVISRITNNVRNRISKESGFVLKYTEKEISDIVKAGSKIGLKEKTIEDFIFVGAREAKVISCSELIMQMENFVNIVTKRGFPFNFDSIKNFAQFKTDLKTLLNKYKIPVEDVRIQGSCLRTPNAKDVDLAIYVSENKFNELCDDMVNGIISRTKENSAIQKNLLNEIAKQRKDGRINSYYFNRVNSQSSLTFNQELFELVDNTNMGRVWLSGTSPFDLSLIVQGKNFDVGPFLNCN